MTDARVSIAAPVRLYGALSLEAERRPVRPSTSPAAGRERAARACLAAGGRGRPDSGGGFEGLRGREKESGPKVAFFSVTESDGTCDASS